MNDVLRRKVGQMFMVGFEGTSPSGEIGDLFEALQPGGVIIMAGNYENPRRMAELTSFIRGLDPHFPPIIAVDQEGGRVNRLKEPLTQFPSPKSLGLLGSEDYVYQVGRIVGKELSAVGINMNLAPVLDVNTNPQNPVIGDRSFGSDPQLVARLGRAYIRGLKAGGVIPVGKHFPGHGATSQDSHKTLPVVEADRGGIEEVELYPFRAAIDEEVPALMTAHVLYPALDSENPATLSHTILTDLLRGDLGFAGLIITDDMNMKAISQICSIGEAAVAAILAGADMLLICEGRERQEEAYNAVLTAVKEGAIPEERIDQSMIRVGSLKGQFIIPANYPPPEQAGRRVGTKSHREFLAQLRQEVGKTL